MYLAVMAGKFVKQDVREWCPSTTGPLLPTMIEWAGYLVPRDVSLPFHNIVARAPNGVSNEHSRSDRIRWTRGGGGGPAHPPPTPDPPLTFEPPSLWSTTSPSLTVPSLNQMMRPSLLNNFASQRMIPQMNQGHRHMKT